MKLSAAQRLCLCKLSARPDDWLCAYDLQEKLSTLNALRKKEYVKSRSGLGSMFSPRTSIEFRITANGSAFVHALRKSM